VGIPHDGGNVVAGRGDELHGVSPSVIETLQRGTWRGQAKNDVDAKMSFR
jgi:hypothetical protein